MKCTYKFMLLILILVSIKSKAQDWQCVREGVTANFVDTNAITQQHPSQTMWVVNIDSVRVYQGWNYHYGYRTTRIQSETNVVYDKYYCYDPYGASRMSIAMSAKGGENFFFNSAGYGIRISTLSHLDQPWICCKINDTTHLYATVISESIESILGVDDSVKNIAFQAKRVTGELVAHPLNSKLFKLSKNFGMITLFDFYTFPNYSSPVHYLIGTSVAGNETGDQNLTYKQIYSFNIGDEFHTEYAKMITPGYTRSSYKRVYKVLDRFWNLNMDTVTYRMDYLSDSWIGYDDIPHNYRKYTVFISYPLFSANCNGTDYFPEQSIFCDTIAYFTVKYFSQYRTSEYNKRWVKFSRTANRLNKCSFCADTLVGIINPLSSGVVEYYIEGCGGPYTYGSTGGNSHPNEGSWWSNSLVYFKKGSETWGEPFDVTNWGKPDLIQENALIRFNLYPNPSSNIITVVIPDLSFTGYKLEVYSVLGNKVNDILLTDTKITLDISNYDIGIYFLKLFKNNTLVGREKLIKF